MTPICEGMQKVCGGFVEADCIRWVHVEPDGSVTSQQTKMYSKVTERMFCI